MRETDFEMQWDPTVRDALQFLRVRKPASSSVLEKAFREAITQNSAGLYALFFSRFSEAQRAVITSLKNGANGTAISGKTQVYFGPYVSLLDSLSTFLVSNLPYSQGAGNNKSQVVPFLDKENLLTLLLFAGATRDFSSSGCLTLDLLSDRLILAYPAHPSRLNPSLFRQEQNQATISFLKALGLIDDARESLFNGLLDSKRFHESLTFENETLEIWPSLISQRALGLNPKQNDIIAYLHDHPASSRKAIAKALRMSDRTVGYHLLELKRRRLIVSGSSGPSTTYSCR